MLIVKCPLAWIAACVPRRWLRQTKHQRRFRGQRGDGADRHAELFSVALGGHHGDATGEMPDGLAEFGWAERLSHIALHCSSDTVRLIPRKSWMTLGTIAATVQRMSRMKPIDGTDRSG